MASPYIYAFASTLQVPPAAVFLDPIEVWTRSERRGICVLGGVVGYLAFDGEHGGGCFLQGKEPAFGAFDLLMAIGDGPPAACAVDLATVRERYT